MSSNVAITCVTDTLTIAGSAVIGPAGGTVNGVYGAQIIVPPGALATPVTIGLSARQQQLARLRAWPTSMPSARPTSSRRTARLSPCR